VKNFSGNREQAVAGHASSGGGGSLGRRSVLGGLAALPVLVGVGAADVGAADSARTAARAARPDGIPTVTESLAAGVERRYNAPLLTPGTRLVLPDGIEAVSVLDYYHGPRLASAESGWPSVMAANGMSVDASVIPERGAPTRVAVLTGFANGWYDVIHANGRADHVAWDAGQFPVLWIYGEFGATAEAPFYNRIYSLALQPFSRNPYSRSTSAR
jgi:hypothetical protein